MAKKISGQGSTAGKVGGDCRWCHETPFRRTVHLLDMIDRGSDVQDLRNHLRTEFAHQEEPFHQAEIRSVEFVMNNYLAEPNRPKWVQWQKNKTSPLVLAKLRGWLRPEDRAEVDELVDNPPF